MTNNSKIHRITVRFSQVEREEIETKAKSIGLSFSDYIRCVLQLIEVPLRVTDVAWETRDLTGEIACTLNRIEKKLSNIQTASPQVEGISLNSICEELKAAIGETIEVIRQVQLEIKGVSFSKHQSLESGQ